MLVNKTIEEQLKARGKNSDAFGLVGNRSGLEKKLYSSSKKVLTWRVECDNIIKLLRK